MRIAFLMLYWLLYPLILWLINIFLFDFSEFTWKLRQIVTYVYNLLNYNHGSSFSAILCYKRIILITKTWNKLNIVICNRNMHKQKYVCSIFKCSHWLKIISAFMFFHVSEVSTKHYFLCHRPVGSNTHNNRAYTSFFQFCKIPWHN